MYIVSLMSNPTSYFELCKMTLNSVSVCPSNMTMTASLALLCAAEEQLSTASQKEKLRHREGKWLAKSEPGMNLSSTDSQLSAWAAK